MRSLRVDIEAGTRCELYYRTDYRGLSTGKDAFMRASLSDLARGDSPARRNALQFIMYHRLGTSTDDPTTVLKNAVRSGTLIAVVEQRRSSGPRSRGSNEPSPRSITFTPSQLFRGAARIAVSIGASAPARIRLPADDGLAIWFAKPGDVLPDGTIATPVATPLGDAQPFEYGDHALSADSMDLAGNLTPNRGAAGSWYTNPGSGQMRMYGQNGFPVVDFDFDHDHGQGIPHAHNWEDNGGPFPIRGPGMRFSPLP